MPYISPKVRKELEEELENLLHVLKDKALGDFTYVLYCIVNTYVEERAKSFHTYADVIGMLEATKLEFFRRAVSPYEDRKIEENGDV